MTLDPSQLLCMRAADGELSPEEEARLEAVGEDPAAWRALPGLLRSAVSVPQLAPGFARSVLEAAELEEHWLPISQALEAASGVQPELAEGVLERIELVGEEQVPAGLLAEALRSAAGSEQELAESVLAELGLSPHLAQVGDALRDAAGAPPALAESVLADTGLGSVELDLGSILREGLAHGELDLADAVMARIEAEDHSGLLAQALESEAGPVPALWDAVSGALDLSEDAAAPELTPLDQTSLGESVVVPLAPAARSRRFERWAMGSALLAAAAAMLVFVTRTDPTPTPERLAAVELSPVNDLELEDIYSEAMVQVIDGEDDSPTIIFISEPIEEDLFGDDQGRL